MYRLDRLIPMAVLLSAGLSVSACSGTSGNFDPTDWITGDFFSTKTPLPGERKPVFPEGVPGVPEGVPKELVKGNQQQQQAEIEAAATPAAQPAPAAKPAPKPAAKPRTASAPRPARAGRAPAPAPQTQPASQPARGGAWPEPDAAQPELPSRRGRQPPRSRRRTRKQIGRRPTPALFRADNRYATTCTRLPRGRIIAS